MKTGSLTQSPQRSQRGVGTARCAVRARVPAGATDSMPLEFSRSLTASDCASRRGRPGGPSLPFPLLCVLCALCVRHAFAASYFVDFSAGDDSNTGASTAAPWQHSPADANATGTPAGVTLSPGDVVNFKGGVTYNGKVTPTWSGTSANWITFQSSPNWGVGRAVFDGSNGLNTNQINVAWSLGGNFILVSGFEIKDYFGNIGFGALGVSEVQGNNCVYSNNFVHHIGVFPPPGFDSIYGGQGVGIQNCSNIVIVSNIIADVNYNAIGGNGGSATNLIFWGNEFYQCQNHGIQTWSRGFTLINGNFFHDFTNGFTHSDSMQLLSVDLNPVSAMIICNNCFSNCVDDINLEMYNPGLFGGGFAPYNLGPMYVFNNVHDNSVPGTGGTAGWNNGDIFDTYNNQSAGLYDFNNTFINKTAGWGSLNFAGARMPTNGIIYLTNFFYLNNLCWNSLGGFGPNSEVAVGISDYNAYTNAYSTPLNANLPGTGANRGTLADFQASRPTNEQHSVAGPITFVNNSAILGSATGDFRPTSGCSIGAGTNLSSLFNPRVFPFNALPAAYRVDPTVDRNGVSRGGGAWDIGAYSFGGSGPPPPPSTPMHARIHP
jgi:hypothetical protein